MSKKVALVILDGWGLGKPDASNGIYLAKTPFIDGLYKKYPNSKLITFGEDVGLPDGQMGNSEVKILQKSNFVLLKIFVALCGIDFPPFYLSIFVLATSNPKKESFNCHFRLCCF